MSEEVMLTVWDINGRNKVDLPCPHAFTWGKNDISKEGGRTENLTMYKNRVGEKRSLHVEWRNTDPETTALILNAFEPEYVLLRYPDALAGGDLTKTFYTGDMKAPVKFWWRNKKRYSTIALDLVER